MRKRTLVGIVASGLASAALITGFALTIPAANAAGVAKVVPAVTEAGHTYFTDAQINQAWASVTSTFPESLPSGVTFPAKAPAFFHPNDGKSHVFESALPSELAARYWRCAWLATDLPNAKHALSAKESALAATQLSPETWESIPGVKANFDVPAYEKAVAGYAQRSGVSAQSAEFQMDCSIYSDTNK